MLHKSLVDDAARGWVDKVASVVLDEEALRDALVDHDEGDLGLLPSLVVQLSEGLTELVDLLVDDLVTLCVTNTIAEDDEVGGELAIMMLSEDLDSLLQRLLHPRLHDLLALALHDVL